MRNTFIEIGAGLVAGLITFTILHLFGVSEFSKAGWTLVVLVNAVWVAGSRDA